MNITNVTAQEILDSRGNPTVEAEVLLENGQTARAAVPSGASTGKHEAVELRDGDMERFGGKGVVRAVENVNGVLSSELIGKDATNQQELDELMLQIDGTENKSHLGANAILAVSMAITRAGALSKQKPLYEYVAELFGRETTTYTMPIPMMNVLNGGKHAAGASDFQEYMIFPIGAPSLHEAVRWGAETFHTLGKLLADVGYATTVGDEGGYAPPLGSNEAPLEFILKAIEGAGYKPGEQIAIALDPAASEFLLKGKDEAYQDSEVQYNLKTENRVLSSSELVQLYTDWVQRFPIVSLEDMFGEDDWNGFAQLNESIGSSTQIMGDDLFVTNTKRLQTGIEKNAANSILIKLNQIGTVTEAIQAIQMAEQHNMTAVVSHRSGETEDTFIADFVVGAGTGQIKTGSLSRSERVAKYNQLMRIERQLGNNSQMATFPFHSGVAY